MKRRHFITTIGTATGGAALLGSVGTAAAGSLSWDTYEGYSYLTFTPSDGSAGAPLVLGLHGCTQEPADFAEAIQIEDWGNRYGYSAIFPNQHDLYNVADCWNWYYDYNCDRYSGAGWDIAQIFAHERAQLNADPDRGYILGFSAGAAFTPNLLVNYPDLYAAAGIHSGVEYDAAETASGAIAVLEYGGPDPHVQGRAAYEKMQALGRVSTVPTITFQGTADTTVEPPNGTQCAIQAATTDSYVQDGGVDTTLSMADHDSGWNGKRYDRYQFTDGSEDVHSELWRVDDLGHAWAGGDASRYYTEPDAPEATKQMFDFFTNWSR
jgi:poly(hydroxyalkanoate) depolymerase family esterase